MEKAQGISITTIVALVIAVIVLVILVGGFTMGWGNLWEKIKGFFAGTNVDIITTYCNTQCAMQQKYNFCCVKKTVILENKEKKEGTCDKLRGILNIECDELFCADYTCPVK